MCVVAYQREYTLDDFYTIDLSKMNRVVRLKECPIEQVRRC